MSRTLLTGFLLALFALTSTGCLYSREIAHTRRDIERQYPGARFDRQVVVSLGPVALRSLGWITGLAPDEEAQLARTYIRDLHRVKVGVYRTDELPPLEDVDLPRLERFRRDGWEVAVKSREEDEIVWVLYRERRHEVRDLYVLVLNEDDLVLARMRGHLDRLLRRAMEDHHALLEDIVDVNS